MVRIDVLPAWERGRVERTRVRCWGGDPLDFDRVRVDLRVGNKTRRMLVGVAKHLPYPVVLGCDWPELLKEMAVVRGAETVEGFVGETKQPLSEEEAGQRIDVPHLGEDEHFQLEQSREADFPVALQEHLA